MIDRLISSSTWKCAILFLWIAVPMSMTTGQAQTTIWSEDFTGFSNGTTSDPGGAWSSTCSGCNGSASSYFEVRGSTWQIRNNDAEGVWTSEWIDVSSYAQVNVEFEVTGDAQNDVGDYCIFEYRTGPGAYSTMDNGSHNPLLAFTTFAIEQLDNMDSVQIRFRGINTNSNENYVIDNIYVYGIDSHQGAGYGLDFDGVNGATTGDVVELPTFPDLIGGSFTITAWINPDNVGQSGQRIFTDDETNASDGWSFSLGDAGSGRLRFYIRSVSGVILDVSNSSYYLSNNQWYHVACVHNAASNTRQIYVNGILAASDTYSGSPGGSPDGVASIGGESHSSSETGNRMDGEIDEVTVWNTALSQSQIRDLMCKKVDVNSSNLLAYYRIDDAVGHTVRDATGNYPGVMINMDPPTDWGYSGAAIGDTSTYTYTGSWSGVSLYLQSSQLDSFSISSVTGTPNGVHVYLVNDKPNDTTGAGGGGANDEYFGVFKAFGSSPTYTGTYYYRNNDAYQLGTFDEGFMVLYKRDNNADTTWIDGSASLDTISKTLTLTGESTEYFLGNTYAPLPITLLSFEARAVDDVVRLDWTTLSEINNDRFEVQRSEDAKHFESVFNVKGAGYSAKEIKYTAYDNSPMVGHYSYYRLKQVDFNGAFSYSPIQAVLISEFGESGIIVFPNPVNGNEFFIDASALKDRNLKISLLDQNGSVLRNSENILHADGIITLKAPEQNGIYLLRIKGDSEEITLRLIKN